MRVISLFSSFFRGGSLEERKTLRFLIYIPFFCLYRGGQSGRKTPRFLIYIPFFCLGRYLHVLNLPAFVYTCMLACVQTDYH